MSDTDRQSWQHWFQPGRFLLLLGLVVLAGYPDVLLGNNTFVTRDFAYFGHPLAYYHKLRFWSGEIPLWNPLNNCGLPFLAQWNTMVLYPGSLFYLLLPLSWSLGLFCLLHLMLGGVGMYFLAWKWTRHRLGACVAGMAFATNGLTLNSLMWPNNISALGWMPWVVLLVELGLRHGGRRLLLTAVVGGMQMLTGAPEIILLTWIFIAGLSIFNLVPRASNRAAMVRRLFGLILLIAGLAAGQLIPFIQLLAHSHRDATFAESDWPMPGTGWANLLVPLFRCWQSNQGMYFQPGQYWTTSYYVGIWTLTLAVAGVVLCRNPRKWLLIFFALLGLILAMGDHGYLYPLLKRYLPMMGFMRFSIKFVVWCVFLLPVLAAFGIKGLLEARTTAGSGPGQIILGLVVLLSLLTGLILWFAYSYPGERERWQDTAFSGLSRTIILWMGLALLALLRSFKPWGSYRLIGAGLVLLAGFDPMTYANQKTPTAPRLAYAPNQLNLSPRPETGESRAITTYWAHQKFNLLSTRSPLNDFLVKRSGLFADCNLLEGIPKLDGFYSLYLREPHSIWSLFYFQTNDPLTGSFFQSTNQIYYDGLLSFLGAAFLSSPKIYYEWTPRTNHLPWLTGGQSPIFTDSSNSLRGLVAANFDPRTMVFLPIEARADLTDLSNTAPVVSAKWSPQQVVAEVSAKSPTLLVVAQSHYYPWKAYQDGKPIQIWRANLAFQAMKIGAGTHTLHLVYEDRGFLAGALISLVALGWLVGRFVSLRRFRY